MTAPAADPRRGPDGRWLCNAAAGCDGPAVIQWAAPLVGGEPDDTVPVYGCADHLPD